MRTPKPLNPQSARDLVSSTRWLTKTENGSTPGRWHGHEEPTTRCVLWTAASTHGYGCVSLDGKVVRAHRVALVAHLGHDLDPGLVVDHKCETPSCVNPDHLQAITHRENVVEFSDRSAAALHAAATHCPRGHALTDANTPEAWKRRGHRGCLVCNRAQAGGQRAVLKAVSARLGVPMVVVRREVGSSARLLMELLGSPDGALIFAEGYAQAEARALEAAGLVAVTA